MKSVYESKNARIFAIWDLISPMPRVRFLWESWNERLFHFNFPHDNVKADGIKMHTYTPAYEHHQEPNLSKFTGSFFPHFARAPSSLSHCHHFCRCLAVDVFHKSNVLRRSQFSFIKFGLTFICDQLMQHREQWLDFDRFRECDKSWLMSILDSV